MIRFSCPSCTLVLKAAPEHAGGKVCCPRCAQRLRVPAPAQNKTILGSLLPAQGSGAANPTALAMPFSAGPTAAGPRTLRRRMIVAGAAVLGCFVALLIVLLGAGRGADAQQAAVKPPAVIPQPAPKPQEVAPGPAVKPDKDNKPAKVDPRPKVKPAEEPKKTALTSEEIFARYSKSVALIRGPNGSGSGFIAAPGLVITNAHVVEPYYVNDLRVEFPSAGPEWKRSLRVERLLFYDKARDLAVLQVKTTLPPLAVARDYKPSPGRALTVIGSPGTGVGGDLPSVLENTLGQGVFGTTVVAKGLQWYHLSIDTYPGNSGGPVFDSSGQVIAVVCIGLKPRMKLCVPADDVHKALAAAAACSPAEAEALAGRQNVRAAFKGLVQIGQEYEAAFSIQKKILQQILQQRGDPNAALAALERKWEPAFQSFQRTLAATRLQIDRLAANPGVPQQTIADLRELTGLCHAMQRLLYEATSPRYTIQQYFSLAEASIQRFASTAKLVQSSL